jgi:hypothetical protein
MNLRSKRGETGAGLPGLGADFPWVMVRAFMGKTFLISYFAGSEARNM